MLRFFVEDPSNSVADAVPDHTPKRPRQKKLEKAVFTEKIAVGHRARDQKRYVAFDRAQCKYRINAVLLDDLRKMIHKTCGIFKS
jgi:hypothetical protein